MTRPTYHVTVTLEGEEDPRRVGQWLTDAFGDTEQQSRPRALRADEDSGSVMIEFDELDADYVPPAGRADSQEESEALTHARSSLHGVDGALLPTIRALLVMSAARERAGLVARQRMRISVEPRVPSQSEMTDDI